MSFRRRMMISAMQGENCLTFDIIAEAGQTFSWQPQGYWGKEYAAMVDIGNGKQAMANNEVISRTYELAGRYEFKIYECYGNFAYWRGDVNLVSSNEKWQYLGTQYKQFYTAFKGMTNSTLALKTLPDGLTSYSGAFYGCTGATLPLTALPDCPNYYEAFRDVKNFSGNLFNIPDSITDCRTMFSNTTGPGRVVLTKLPPHATSLSVFASNSNVVYANLTELAANAPEGGYQALTSLYYAFYGNANVTGSRSAFLAVCPNVTDTTNAFTNTNTTE